MSRFVNTFLRIIRQEVITETKNKNFKTIGARKTVWLCCC